MRLSRRVLMLTFPSPLTIRFSFRSLSGCCTPDLVVTTVSVLDGYLRETMAKWGLSRQWHTGLVGSHARIPAAEGVAPLVIQDLDPHLQQQMCASLRPAHLLPLFKAFGDHLIDRRLDEAGGDPLAVAEAVLDGAGAVAGRRIGADDFDVTDGADGL